MTGIPKGFAALVDAAAVLVIIGVTFWWLGLFQRNKKW